MVSDNFVDSVFHYLLKLILSNPFIFSDSICFSRKWSWHVNQIDKCNFRPFKSWNRWYFKKRSNLLCKTDKISSTRTAFQVQSWFWNVWLQYWTLFIICQRSIKVSSLVSRSLNASSVTVFDHFRGIIHNDANSNFCSKYSDSILRSNRV